MNVKPNKVVEVIMSIVMTELTQILCERGYLSSQISDWFNPDWFNPGWSRVEHCVTSFPHTARGQGH